jgi:aspartyl/asparaginyl-tRNA synthetase
MVKLSAERQASDIDTNYLQMKTFYQITSKEVGAVLLKRRKIAKALRWWLRENGFSYTSNFRIK